MIILYNYIHIHLINDGLYFCKFCIHVTEHQNVDCLGKYVAK